MLKAGIRGVKYPAKTYEYDGDAIANNYVFFSDRDLLTAEQLMDIYYKAKHLKSERNLRGSYV